MTWRDQALCAETDPELFFPEKCAPTAPAKQVCALCDVRAECLAEALALGADGVWGGLSPKKRQRLGGKPYATAAPFLPTADHGTEAGYQRHRRAGEPACQLCRDASAAAGRQRGAA